uniref:Uncharacterized protein n=1 Tax=Corethron hystrix TaxID=216773 RepID=A0A7S1G0E7_9STRA
MVVTIVDLAATALADLKKDGDNTVTVRALDVVIDFMNHAAELFLGVIGDEVTIEAVVYSGSLGKGKLEQLYSAYAEGSMAGTKGKASMDRLGDLQNLLGIKDKKAEGISQKAMMKGFMKMMQDGEDGEGDMAGMAEMMQGMMGENGDMPDMSSFMGGMPGAEDMKEPSPEELKQGVAMMKQLVESGAISKDDLKAIREEFASNFGMDINELIEQADNPDVKEALGEDGRELLNLFKQVLD